MKKNLIVAAVMLLAFCGALQAKNWRINSDPEAKADFLSINDAMASLDVYPGDVLYLDPGCQLPSQTVTKGVTIIGTGYNLSGAVEEAFIDGVSIAASDVKLYGINITSGIGFVSGTKNNNITIERCKTREIYCYYYNGTNLKVVNCYVAGQVYGHNYGVQLRNSIILGQVNAIKNGIIRNCVIIDNGYDGNPTSTSASNYVIYDVTNTSIANNIIINTNTKSQVNGNTTAYFNHQTIYNVSETDANSINNNILSNDAEHSFAIYKSNYFIGATIEDVFEWKGTLDERFTLKEGSPAIGAGTNGDDCGVYGGGYPYVVSGLPKFVPYIMESKIPTTPTDGKLNITLKIKSQNE